MIEGSWLCLVLDLPNLKHFEERKLFYDEDIGVRGGGGGRPPGLEKFQGKLCFQGNRKFLKNPE